MSFLNDNFAYPLVLVLLIIPLSILYGVWRRQLCRLVLPFDHAPHRSGRWLGVLVNLAESLPALILGTIVCIAAGPTLLGDPQTKRVLTNIEFCVDVSGSMTAEFGDGTRYDASMKAINQFLDHREGDAFGLTFFGSEVIHWVPLTSDVSAIRYAPPFMNPSNPQHPTWLMGTQIGKMLEACKVQLVQREKGDKMIILVSDGSSADLFNERDMQIAKSLREYNIVVFAIHIDESEVPDPIANITSLTGGAVFNPGDPAALETVFQRIDEMQETQLEKTAAEMMDHFWPYCVVGLSLLGLSSFLLFGLRYTPW